ncbi:TrkH family potassium uptake protein [Bengtsoniella intestinalis]|uniref:TrkH family potassium uptake protein n=1 Tax=Bengtsoniella intestinalis TaxID=3073143 RepID=UPI00391F5C77
MEKLHRPRFNAMQTLTLGFAVIILVGGLLLSLPFATKSSIPLPFLDALFTATSATCVTGLALYDTFTTFTWFGQAVMLCLIQIGGLGFMTVSILVAFLLGKRIGLHQRSILMDAVGSLSLAGVVHLTRMALICTGVIEGVGTVLLAFWFVPQFGLWQGLWHSLFHAVSAYCNAGFDLMGIVSAGSSLTTVYDQVYLNLVIMALIIAGGLGFLVWNDLLSNRFAWKNLRLHSKIVLSATGILLLGGTVAFYLLEYNQAFAGYGLGTQWLMAAFQSVSPRTAGFNTVDLNTLSPAGMLLTLVLMFIGADSASTGGGLKVNTIAILLLSTVAQLRRKRDITIFHRRLDLDSLNKAYSTAMLYSLCCILGTMVLTLNGYSLVDSLFEAISAMGTVGLTLGITPSLPLASKLAVMAMMFIGRVGSVSVAMAMTNDKPQPKIRYLKEQILIG